MVWLFIPYLMLRARSQQRLMQDITSVIDSRDGVFIERETLPLHLQSNDQLRTHS